MVSAYSERSCGAALLSSTFLEMTSVLMKPLSLASAVLSALLAPPFSFSPTSATAFLSCFLPDWRFFSLGALVASPELVSCSSFSRSASPLCLRCSTTTCPSSLLFSAFLACFESMVTSASVVTSRIFCS